MYISFGWGGGSVDRCGYLILNYTIAARLPPRARLWSTKCAANVRLWLRSKQRICPAALAASVWSCLQVFGRSVSLEQAGCLSSGTPLHGARRWRDRRTCRERGSRCRRVHHTTGFLRFCVRHALEPLCLTWMCTSSSTIKFFVADRKLLSLGVARARARAHGLFLRSG